MIITTVVILMINFAATVVNGQYSGCDYYQNVVAGQSYEIFSPYYPYSYYPGSNCRWAATSPVGTTIYLECTSVNLPYSSNCIQDKLLVSLGGRPDLSDAYFFCGSGAFAKTTTSNKLVMALRSASSSKGGGFYCKLTVLPAQNTCTCGRRKSTRIVGGTQAGVNEFTMMAGLVDLVIREVACGATIISDLYAITAAHCTPSTGNFALLVGEHDLTIGTETPFTSLYQIANILRHASYQANSGVNDISLIKTTTKIAFNNGVGPVCLPFKFRTNTFVNAVVEAAGWGTLEFGGPRPDILMKVTLNVISNAQCSSKYPSLTTSSICTLTPNKDSCQYDSGGALYYTAPNNLIYQIGVMNYGNGCAFAGNPGVSLRVTEYLDWIISNTQNTQFCNI